VYVCVLIFILFTLGGSLLRLASVCMLVLVLLVSFALFLCVCVLRLLFVLVLFVYLFCGLLVRHGLAFVSGFEFSF